MKCDLINKKDNFNSIIIKILVENEFYALSRIISILSQTGIFIKNLTIVLTQDKKFYYIISEIIGKKKNLHRTKKKINKLINVIKISVIKNINYCIRETILIKIKSKLKFSKEIKTLIKIFHAKIIYIKKIKYIIELSENDKKIKEFLQKIKEFGKIIKISYSGKNLISKK